VDLSAYPYKVLETKDDFTFDCGDADLKGSKGCQAQIFLLAYCSTNFLFWCSRQDATQPIIIRGRKTIKADNNITCIIYSLFSTDFLSFVVHKRPRTNPVIANARPLIIIMVCGNSPRKMPAMNIPPKTSFPKSSISFPRFSLKVVSFRGFFSYPILIIYRFSWLLGSHSPPSRPSPAPSARIYSHFLTPRRKARQARKVLVSKHSVKVTTPFFPLSSSSLCALCDLCVLCVMSSRANPRRRRRRVSAKKPNFPLALFPKQA